ncbi:hypothetical protein [Marinagarivorans cellulosilyticus]|uniref:DUF4760 domain-containing protein n=1 Tax=Marinagarivorans cellulosilyticus TaxID=2721545 RepID=A0AAN1WLI2_9GAMM|nr:hypothetical protein [Marinagarivorans cellulosilyticus]BCD99846.1 hypothetical protein MARGE09_P4048 [Marinagarivorans cellulosilyticus]
MSNESRELISILLSNGADLATIAAVLISMVALFFAIREYIIQGKLKRADYFLHMRDRIFSDPDFNAVYASLSDEGGNSIDTLTLDQKETYLGFIEEIAVLENSKLINTQTAYYMFGYCAISCWRSDLFWRDVSREDKYWSLFKDFAERMCVFDTEREIVTKKVKL